MGGKGSGGHNRRGKPRPMDHHIHPWERQPGESAKAFEAFEAYRTLGVDRTHRKTAEILKKSPVTLNVWSTRWSWVMRVNAWDDYLKQQERDEEVRVRREKVREMIDRHLGLAETMQYLGGTVITELAKKVEESLREGSPMPTVSINEGRLLIEAGARLERLSRGEATDRGEVISFSPSDLTDEQLERIAAGEDPKKVVR